MKKLLNRELDEQEARETLKFLCSYGLSESIYNEYINTGRIYYIDIQFDEKSIEPAITPYVLSPDNNLPFDVQNILNKRAKVEQKYGVVYLITRTRFSGYDYLDLYFANSSLDDMKKLFVSETYTYDLSEKYIDEYIDRFKFMIKNGYILRNHIYNSNYEASGEPMTEYLNSGNFSVNDKVLFNIILKSDSNPINELQDSISIQVSDINLNSAIHRVEVFINRNDELEIEWNGSLPLLGQCKIDDYSLSDERIHDLDDLEYLSFLKNEADNKKL